MRIAVLLTTHNRKEKTVACLMSLKNQRLTDDVEIDIHLTDAASIDNTVEAVKTINPNAFIYNASSSLFWAGGMRNSWKEAVKHKPDYYLLLNDDTILTENAIAVLLGHHHNKTSVCIGSTIDPDTKERSYGGRRLTSRNTWKDDLIVFSENEYLPCDVSNANIMMVPKLVVDKIGILSDKYTHGLADYDYTLKANKAGFKVLVAPGYLGTCIDDHGKNWKSNKSSLRERINYLKSPKGLAYDEYMIFIKNHFPLSYPSAFFKMWVKTLFPSVWETLKK